MDSIWLVIWSVRLLGSTSGSETRYLVRAEANPVDYSRLKERRADAFSQVDGGESGTLACGRTPPLNCHLG